MPHLTTVDADVVTTCYHVYFARGKGKVQHPGNVKYRELISEHCTNYIAATHPKDRTKIAEKVITSIQILGGKFFQYIVPDQDEDNSSTQQEGDPRQHERVPEWQELNPVIVLKKVKQSLRDKAAKMSIVKNNNNNGTTKGISPPPAG